MNNPNVRTLQTSSFRLCASGRHQGNGVDFASTPDFTFKLVCKYSNSQHLPLPPGLSGLLYFCSCVDKPQSGGKFASALLAAFFETYYTQQNRHLVRFPDNAWGYLYIHSPHKDLKAKCKFRLRITDSNCSKSFKSGLNLFSPVRLPGPFRCLLCQPTVVDMSHCDSF